MNFQKRMEFLEQEMDQCSGEMKWHEDKIKLREKEMEDLQTKWNHVAAEQELMLAIHHLKRFFNYLKITDIDPQKEFLEYIRCVLVEQIEGEIGNVTNLLNELFEKVEEKE